MTDERGFDSHTLQINMTQTTYNKVNAFADQMLGQEGMDKYPLFLVIGLLFISLSIRKYKILPTFE